MSDLDDYLDDFEEMPEGAEWCDRCQGLGTAECYCGGDQCYCENYGEMECPRCGGEGYWVPTEAQKKAREAGAAFIREMWAKHPAQADTHPKGGDCLQAPSPMSGTVGDSRCAQTPSQTPSPSSESHP